MEHLNCMPRTCAFTLSTQWKLFSGFFFSCRNFKRTIFTRKQVTFLTHNVYVYTQRRRIFNKITKRKCEKLAYVRNTQVHFGPVSHFVQMFHCVVVHVEIVLLHVQFDQFSTNKPSAGDRSIQFGIFSFVFLAFSYCDAFTCSEICCRRDRMTV